MTAPTWLSSDPPTLSALVERQANDPALWFVAQTAPEAYLQKALRELHRAIEESPADLSEEAREVVESLRRIFELWNDSFIDGMEDADAEILTQAAALIERLSQRNAGLERDAERYRWLRDKRISGGELPTLAYYDKFGKELLLWDQTRLRTDMLIDNAIAALKGERT